ncbi:NADPH-dependent FMN reductase [Amaricoccus solimangrovi]|uniref:NAD(P)H-dependent oxidoreductase n=1 Tax=Amaricoccus solimangrovi TaxID=2589815 RepID=A0A501WMW9_9RHOB|nr:NADPH-dependent FMN reductase [Amaricoccus solimangrovi]TPE50202.1 NAD(P)H-dependent oxidoreductase [Amaricoccus solimangrovi]
MRKISVLVGSLRAASINRTYAKALGKLGADLFEFDYPSLDLPLYNEDLWPDPPESVFALKRSVEAADAVLFVTPEYNRSFTPATKNAIDWGSRPVGQPSWPGKPAAITGASGGAIGTAAAQAQLRSIVVGRGMVLMGQPELYYSFKPEGIDAEGNFTSDKTREIMRGFLEKFSAWIEKHG